MNEDKTVKITNNNAFNAEEIAIICILHSVYKSEVLPTEI